jgi:hypothetical protein
MAEGGERGSGRPAPGDVAGGAEGGAAPGSQRRDTASGRVEEYRAAETAERGWEIGLMTDIKEAIEKYIEAQKGA